MEGLVMVALMIARRLRNPIQNDPGTDGENGKVH